MKVWSDTILVTLMRVSLQSILVILVLVWLELTQYGFTGRSYGGRVEGAPLGCTRGALCCMESLPVPVHQAWFSSIAGWYYFYLFLNNNWAPVKGVMQ